MLLENNLHTVDQHVSSKSASVEAFNWLISRKLIDFPLCIDFVSFLSYHWLLRSDRRNMFLVCRNDAVSSAEREANVLPSSVHAFN